MIKIWDKTLNFNSAAICTVNGWVVGDKLIGDEGFGDETIMITAIGESNVLARKIMSNGRPVDGCEGLWSLSHRDWRKV